MQPESELTAAWLRKADDDIRAAEVTLSAHPPLYWVSAFHAQQAVEKALKGILSYHQVEYEKSHDIGYLIELCETLDPRIGAIGDMASRLTRYAVDARYPMLRTEPMEDDARAALDVAREVVGMVRQSLSPSAQDRESSTG